MKIVFNVSDSNNSAAAVSGTLCSKAIKSWQNPLTLWKGCSTLCSIVIHWASSSARITASRKALNVLAGTRRNCMAMILYQCTMEIKLSRHHGFHPAVIVCNTSSGRISTTAASINPSSRDHQGGESLFTDAFSPRPTPCKGNSCIHCSQSGWYGFGNR